jgi:hypothetical protein
MQNGECGTHNDHSALMSYSAFSILNSAFKALGSETASRLAYTQKSEGQHFPSDHF